MSDRQALIARLRLALDFAAPRAWCEIGEDVVCECITALEEAQGVPHRRIADLALSFANMRPSAETMAAEMEALYAAPAAPPARTRCYAARRAGCEAVQVAARACLQGWRALALPRPQR